MRLQRPNDENNELCRRAERSYSEWIRAEAFREVSFMTAATTEQPSKRKNKL